MDASLLFGVSGALSGLLAAGVAGLVFMRKNGNGHTPAALPPTSPQLVEEWQLDKMREVLEPLTLLPQAIRAGFEPVIELLEEQATNPLPVPLVQLHERLDIEHALNQASIRHLDEGLAVISELLAHPPPPVLVEPPAPPPIVVESPQLEALARRLEAALRTRPAPAHGAPPPVPALFIAPPQPSGPQVQLSMFNCYTLVPDEVYTLIPPDTGVHQINLVNYGPGALYVRALGDPDPLDPHSELIAASWADNDIPIPVSLNILCTGDVATVSMRLSFQ